MTSLFMKVNKQSIYGSFISRCRRVTCFFRRLRYNCGCLPKHYDTRHTLSSKFSRVISALPWSRPVGHWEVKEKQTDNHKHLSSSSGSGTVTIVGSNSSPVTTPTNITSNQRTKLVCSLTNMAPTACSHVATGPVLLAPVEDIAVEAPSTLLCLRLPCSGITSYSSVSHGLSSRGLSNEFELSCDP